MKSTSGQVRARIPRPCHRHPSLLPLGTFWRTSPSALSPPSRSSHSSTSNATRKPLFGMAGWSRGRSRRTLHSTRFPTVELGTAVLHLFCLVGFQVRARVEDRAPVICMDQLWCMVG